MVTRFLKKFSFNTFVFSWVYMKQIIKLIYFIFRINDKEKILPKSISKNKKTTKINLQITLKEIKQVPSNQQQLKNQ